MKNNQENMREGVCRYCGQVRMVTLEASASQEDVDMLATKECDCPSAKIQRDRDQRYEKASRNIEKIFKDSQETAEILKMAAKKIVNDEIDSVAVKCGRMTGKASATSKGTIKVSRTDKDETYLED